MPYLALLFAVLAWGLSFIVTGQAIKTFPFLVFLQIRFVLAALILWLILLLSRRMQKVRPADFKLMLFLFLAQPVGYFAFETLGLKFTSPSSVSLILSLAPLFTLFLESRFQKERLFALQKAGVVLSVLGTLLFVGYDKGFIFESSHLAGEIFAVLASVSAAFFVLLSRKLSARYSSLTTTTFQFSFASLAFLPFSLAQAGGQTLDFSAGIFKALIFLVLICSVLAFLAVNYALAHIKSSQASSLLNLIPMVTVAGEFFLGKPLTLIHLSLMLLAVAGTFLANRKPRSVNVEY